MAVINFPCKNCQKRTMNCHSTCKEYKETKALLDKAKEEKRRYSDSDDFIFKSIAKKSKNIKRNYGSRNFTYE